MFSWTLRISGWIIGIYAMLKLAAATGTVTYTTVFQAWLDQLRDFLDLGFILKPLTQAVILPALDLIRSFDIPIPPLQDHWQQVFVLTWLLSAAWARNMSELASIPVALMTAFFCTLPFCVAAGTMPVGSEWIAFWPAIGVVSFFGVLTLLADSWRPALDAKPSLRMRGATIAFVRLLVITVGALSFAAAFAASSYLIPNTGEGAAALMRLAATVGGLGLGMLVLGRVTARIGVWLSVQSPAATASGLDITAAMLGAFGLGTAFADPPLF